MLVGRALRQAHRRASRSHRRRLSRWQSETLRPVPTPNVALVAAARESCSQREFRAVRYSFVVCFNFSLIEINIVYYCEYGYVNCTIRMFKGTFVISNELGGSVVVINVSDGYIVRRIEDHADQLITSLCVSSDIFCFEQPIPKVSSSIRNSRNTVRVLRDA